MSDTPNDCPFCDPLAEDQSVVLENAHCRFLQQPDPTLAGAGVIVPRRHRDSVFDLSAEEWAATGELLRQAKALLDERHAPDGYNVGWNTGEVGGQEIFHAHCHVIPRYADEPLAGKGIRYWLKQEEPQIES
ncbi:MAG: HIT family protein [Anaerolineales bacterium]|nr:HIT family protein [Anaerolineales bacterium]MCB9128360.1 HIT family protein [Ardenticatenales bacterium]MCB9172172.1 HIT family protein [Ardenticatenales bacterium]